ncbi:MAG TPA: transcription elongation factor GreA [Clostridiales bacterium]|jgi:transcription elongation factor GreA|nr:transcription elongation factor GreA [Clostridiales bacterium]
MAKEYKMTQEKLEALKQELYYLRTERADEVNNKLKEARSFGDLSENSEYDEAKNEQGKLYSRIHELDNILENAVIVSESELPTDRVGVGSRVLLQYGDDEPEWVLVVGSQEADPWAGKISDESPLGRAIMDGKPGQTVSFLSPAGVQECTILEIQ